MPRSLSELSSRRSPAGTSGPTDAETAEMLAAVGYASARRPGRCGRARGVRATAADLPAGRQRGRGPRPAARARRGQRGLHLDDRAGLLRHGHPGGHPAQRAGEPGLVHRLHALPAGDQPGPARGAAQLPDDGRRPDRAADRRRLDARRGDRRRRGDDAGPPGRPREAGRGLRRRRRHAAADPRGAADPRRAAGHRLHVADLSDLADRPARGRRVRRAAVQYPGASGPVRDHRALVADARTTPGAWSSSPPTCWR